MPTSTESGEVKSVPMSVWLDLKLLNQVKTMAPKQYWKTELILMGINSS